MLNDEGELTPLTDSSEHIHTYGGCSADGKWISWSSNRRDSRYFDVYIQSLEHLTISCVFEGDARFDPVKWHPSGNHLLVQKTNTNLDNDLSLLCLNTKKMHWLTTHTGEASFSKPYFSADGKWLYALSNRDEEYVGLIKIEIATCDWEWLLQAGWDIEELAMNRDHKWLAYTVNEGGISNAFVYSLHNTSSLPIPAKRGVISNFSFSHDGNNLAFELNGASHPADLWTYNFKTTKTERLTYVSYSPAVEEKLVEPNLIEFPSFDGQMIPCFYYKPQSEGPHPVVVFVHGGPESQIRSVYNPFLQYFIYKGFAVCTPNVRGSTGYGKTYSHLDDKRKRMDAVKDLDSLAEWLKTEGSADPDRIAIMGRSYGGFMVLAAITHYPRQWAAAIDIVGISSFKSFLENTSIWRRRMREAEYGSLEEDQSFFKKIDPIHRTKDISAPLLVLHGRNDPRVPVSEAEQLVANLKERSHPVSYICFEDEGHFFVRTENNRTAYTETAAFLTKWLY